MVSQVKGISLALIDCALRYHKYYIEEDLAVFGEQCIAEAEKQVKEAEAKPEKSNQLNEDGSITKHKKYRHNGTKEAKQVKAIKGMILDREHKANVFAKAIEERIKTLTNEINTGSEEFTKYIQQMGLTLEEYVKAKDQSQFLMICTMYNQGKFDHVFEELKKEAAPIITAETKILSLEEIQKRDALH